MDAHVARHLFDQLIGPGGLLQNKTRILVTHSLNFLHKVDRILVMDGGRVVGDGTLQELQAQNDPAFLEFFSFIGEAEGKTESVQEETEKIVDNINEKDEKKAESGKLISKEVKGEGRVSLRHYKFYLQAMGFGLFAIVIFLFIIAEAFKVGGNLGKILFSYVFDAFKYLTTLVLADWTANFDVSTNWNYIGYYSLLALACSLAGMLSQIGSQYRAAAASKQIQAALLERTMHAPVNIIQQQTRQTLKHVVLQMSFFETTPTGRILNRFSSDLDVIDMKIPMQLKNFLSCLTVRTNDLNELHDLDICR